MHPAVTLPPAALPTAETLAPAAATRPSVLPLAADSMTPDHWFGWLLGAPAWSMLAVLVGLVVLAVLRWLISRAVRSVVVGGTTVRRHAHRLLLRTRVGGVTARSDALGVARRVQRAETMGSVLRSSAGIVVGIGVLTVVANINDWNLGPVIASAGVVGVALGFGAQTLVKDFLSGIFMLAEDQYGVGDVVDLGEASGTVEAIGLRVTQVRDLQGTLWYVRNGEILRVGNKTQGWARALVEVRVGPDQDVDQAVGLLRAAAATMLTDETLGPDLLGEPEVTAFEDLSGESVLLRVMVKVGPAKQWEVQRHLRSRIKAAFTGEGIALALPRREVQVEREAHVDREVHTASGSSSGDAPPRQDQSSTA